MEYDTKRHIGYDIRYRECDRLCRSADIVGAMLHGLSIGSKPKFPHFWLENKWISPAVGFAVKCLQVCDKGNAKTFYIHWNGVNYAGNRISST